jgi:hypothetical protein
MSGIQSIVRGLPGNKHTLINHPGGVGVTTKVLVVESPPDVRRRLVGGDPDQGVNNTVLRVVNNGVNPADFNLVLVTPDGNFVLQTVVGLAIGAEAVLGGAWVLRDDETIEVWAIAGAVAVLDVFATFSDLRSTEVGRGRVQIKASVDATKYEVVPKPTAGRVHVPWGKTTVSYYAIKDGDPAAATVRTYLDDDGTVVQCGAANAVAAGTPVVSAALVFAVRALKNQRLLASAVLNGTGDAWAFPVYLIVPDPKVGQAGSSA